LPDKQYRPRPLISYSFSPLVADPIGFLALELGNGELSSPAFLNQSSFGKPLPNWTKEEQNFILSKSALPFLNELKEKCHSLLQQDNLVLLITLRSFPSKPWNFENNRRYPRPQLNIGILNETKTPGGLASFIGKTFRVFNFWPELNWPHPGAYLPQELFQSPRLFACGLSFRRDLYMDESTGRLHSGAESLARVLKSVFALLEEELENVVEIRIRRKYPPKPPSNVIKAPKPQP
jgi:hypothetical protein